MGGELALSRKMGLALIQSTNQRVRRWKGSFEVAWQDRDYNRGGGTGDFLSNPAGILSLSIPFFALGAVRVRLHFWLLLTIVFTLASLFNGEHFVVVIIQIAMLLAALLLHDFGHRVFTQWVGGTHDQFMLWPVGGLEFPKPPPGAWPLFVAFVGGIAVNLLLGIGSIALLYTRGINFIPPLNPLANLGGGMFFPSGSDQTLLVVSLMSFAMINCGLVLGNLLPYFWFDGGYLLRSLLWPFLGASGALNVTCIIGMILAVPMFALALRAGSLMGLIFWALLFSSSYTARHTMAAMEPEFEYAGDPRRNWNRSSHSSELAKRRKLEQKIDKILAKVSAQGMHSLTWWEKRTLRKGSQKLR